mmetsp:Transcript_7826/g.9991  ORF Transcript_7826/g.9991 Transcript_7826/m.9991 type:complete len:184 (+) Transcript_7826:56-607(+)
MEIVEIKEEEEDPIEALEEYSAMLNDLGNFADIVQINTLSMVAEDYKSSTSSSFKIYKVIRTHLLKKKSSPARKLPLVYVVDSILKNAKGQFVTLMEADAKNWLPVVYGMLNSDGRAKLKRVWNTWREFGIFGLKSWEEMGLCFRREEEQKAEELQSKSADGAGSVGGFRKMVSCYCDSFTCV